MTDINATLAERGARYGDFSTHAVIAMAIKRIMECSRGWAATPDPHQQALHVIADKIARILNGDPNYADNWHDIAGYATLVERIIAGGSQKNDGADSILGEKMTPINPRTAADIAGACVKCGGVLRRNGTCCNCVMSSGNT